MSVSRETDASSIIKYNESEQNMFSDKEAEGQTLSSKESTNHIQIRRNRRRRDKNSKGNFSCKYCDKSYLTFSGLYTHCLGKHNKTATYPTTNKSYLKNKKDERNSSLFKTDNELIRISEIISSDKALSIIEQEIVSLQANNDLPLFSFKKILPKHYTLYRDFQVYTVLNSLQSKKKINCDAVLSYYLYEKSKEITCENEFRELANFTILLREKINDYFRNLHLLYNKVEYTEIGEVNDVPCVINDFLNDYMRFLQCKEDRAISYAKNLCHWLYSNKHTTLELKN